MTAPRLPVGPVDAGPHGSDTLILAPSQLRRLIVARHDAETIAARIGADCERMLRAVNQPSRREWRDAIGGALLSSRHVLSAAQASVSLSEEQAATQLAELEATMRASLAQVGEAVETVLRLVPQTVEDELLVEDARAVRALALAPWSTSRALSVGPVNSADGSLENAALARPDSDSDRLRAATILIVDDDVSVRQMLQRLLQRFRYDVVLAANGREGLESALKMPPDLVLTDINMPEMHGLSLLRELKSAPGLKHIPVVVVSAEGDLGKVVQSIELGADDYIPKPFDPTLLQARIRSSLTRKRLRDLELDHLKRVGQIAAAAQAVDRNVYQPGSLDAVARGHDQIAQLARVFEKVVLNLKSREDRLAHRLKSLRREVSSLSTTQVGEALRSDFSPFGSGDRVANRYTIIGAIGRGGMGMVYHAHDAELQEDIALKVVRADVIKDDPTLVSRLRSEIRLSRKLAHPNIVRAYDLGESRGTYFITMEFVRGVTLSASLDERGRFSPDAVIAIGIQLSDALAVAHEQNVVHRDIKPGNLMMDEDGRLKVMDFGLAKRVDLPTERGETMPGHVIGTPAYMAPEQLMGGTLDGRTDLFAVGVVLYECLSGKPPFDDEHPGQMLSDMANGTYPALTNTVPEIPPALDKIIRRLLLVEPDARIQSATELSRQLAEIEIIPATT